VSPRQEMSLSLFSKTELQYIQGSRDFTKEQARVLRYRINKKLKKNQAKDDTDNNQNQQLEHSSAVFGVAAYRWQWREPQIPRSKLGGSAVIYYDNRHVEVAAKHAAVCFIAVYGLAKLTHEYTHSMLARYFLLLLANNIIT
jgi:hypothetical protein